MKLQENIHRIKEMMGIINEDAESLIRKMIDDIGVVNTIKLMGGLHPDMVKYISIEDMIDFIKTEVTKLCDEEDDIEVGGPGFYSVPIVYEETEDQIHLIEFYRREGVVIERYVTGGGDYDDGDNYLGSYRKRYEELSPSILTDIFQLLLTKIYG